MNESSPGRSRYIVIAERLREAILHGEYPPGAQLPAARELCHQFGCGLEVLRDAQAVLRRELLISTRQGIRPTVCAPPVRTTVPLRPGDVVTAWMPTLPEAIAWNVLPEMPILTVVRDADHATRYAADQVQLWMPTQQQSDLRSPQNRTT